MRKYEGKRIDETNEYKREGGNSFSCETRRRDDMVLHRVTKVEITKVK